MIKILKFGILIIVVIMAGACKNKSFLDGFSNRHRFEDFNFQTMQGVTPLENDKPESYISVNKDQNIVKLGIYSKLAGIPFRKRIEEFKQIDDYYYRYYEDDGDNPDILVATSIFIREKDILIYDIATEKGQPFYSKVKQILPNAKNIIEYEFPDFLIEPRPYVDLSELLGNKNLFTVTTKHLSCEKGKLVVRGKIKNYKGWYRRFLYFLL